MHWYQLFTPGRIQAHRKFLRQAHDLSVLVRDHKGAFENTWLTYDDEAFTDGLGAQFHRVLGVFALARALGAKYLHTPISTLGYLGTPRSRVPQDATLARINEITRLRSDPGADPSLPTSLISSPSAAELLAGVGTKEKPAIIRMVLANEFVDTRPAYWAAVSEIAPVPVPRGQEFRIAIHVRRGDIHFQHRHRLLPNRYYIEVASRMGKLVRDLGLTPRFEIYSETLTPGATFTPSGFVVTNLQTVNNRDLDHFEDFAGLQPLDLHLDEPVVDTIERMTTADALITSKSGLSAVAAILNPNRPILWYPFWLSPMPNFVTTSRRGVFDESAVRAQIR